MRLKMHISIVLVAMSLFVIGRWSSEAEWKSLAAVA